MQALVLQVGETKAEKSLSCPRLAADGRMGTHPFQALRGNPGPEKMMEEFAGA